MRTIKLIVSSAYASVIAIVFVVVITVWAELSAPLKQWLQGFSGHHWVSKSIFSLVLFAAVLAVFYVIPLNNADKRLKSSLVLLFFSVLFGVAAITLFFTLHYFGLLA